MCLIQKLYWKAICLHAISYLSCHRYTFGDCAVVGALPTNRIKWCYTFLLVFFFLLEKWFYKLFTKLHLFFFFRFSQHRFSIPYPSIIIVLVESFFVVVALTNAMCELEWWIDTRCFVSIKMCFRSACVFFFCVFRSSFRQKTRTFNHFNKWCIAMDFFFRAHIHLMCVRCCNDFSFSLGIQQSHHHPLKCC